ncbi:hypothetical protein [Leifsonia sp. NPDC058230]|uniref:hypothetical protein n=1 Tax=Leifsonia sp. NPDC058230 TaxID=3346391 RepID=UPI0036DA5043
MRNGKETPASDPRFGVGVQVHVVEPATPGGDDWVGEPTGVIIGTGAASLRSVNLPAGATTSWLVAFDEPQLRRDGRGPFERANIEQALLVAAEPISED